jgi:carbon monoxide dehydrogenase subunit G
MKAPREKVYALLTDPNFIAKSLPDSEDVKVLDSSSLEAKLKLRISIVSSTMKMKVIITDKEPSSRASLLAVGSGSGSNLKIASVFNLSGENSTTLSWSADAEISGIMAGLGSAILRGFATKKVGAIFGGITSAVESAAAGPNPGV